MSDRTPEIELLIEAVTAAHRARDRDGAVQFHPAWYDLDEPERHEAFQRTCELRALEAHLDPAGLSTTAKAILARIR
ncbi:hypothetical protein LZC95_30185 [Pendulispora brunnea]|uniref:ABM domain-containing protein n=1 Tax=Pendulispora brunnea TaxID=2905690 RepID=A0ABZ2K0Y5_9BACT